VRTLNLFFVFVAFTVATEVGFAQNPFATRVVSFDPAPGTFAQQASFNVATRAIGPPRAGTLSVPDNTSIVSLGAFGGSITLAFDHTVLDHPLNPFGMDAIVFGNAFFLGGDEYVRWAEAGTIEISRDVNTNGLADDAWYLIPGSHIDPLATNILNVTWDADTGDATYPPSSESWLPPGAVGTWETGNYELPLEVFGNFIVENFSADSDLEEVFGYADFSPTLPLGGLDGDGIVDDEFVTAETFYTTPDDPFTVGMTAGSGGGDAFDIAWAVDEATGLPAGLDGFDFVRVTTAVFAIDSVLGEISTEIDAISDVAPDLIGDSDGDEDIDIRDLAALLACFGAGSDGCAVFDRNGDGAISFGEVSETVERLTGPEWGER